MSRSQPFLRRGDRADIVAGAQARRRCLLLYRQAELLGRGKSSFAERKELEERASEQLLASLKRFKQARRSSGRCLELVQATFDHRY